MIHLVKPPVSCAPIDNLFGILAKESAELILQLRDSFARRIDFNDTYRAVFSLNQIEAEKIEIENLGVNRLGGLDHFHVARMRQTLKSQSAHWVLLKASAIIILCILS